MTNKALTFLRAVLPEAGIYVATIKLVSDPKDRRVFNSVAYSLEDLAQLILAEDAKGRTVWHGCASYLNANGVLNPRNNKFEIRSKDNVRSARSLWIECDGGPGKPFADPPAAAEAIAAFCANARLPAPLYVASGHGVHAYWPLAVELDRATWEAYAAGLKATAVHFGLKADPQRTADIASVLRTPGTFNRKAALVEVENGPIVGPYPLENFAHLLAVTPVQKPKPTAPTTIDPRLAALGNVQVKEASYAENIADRCAQVGRLRDTAGNIPEPEWYATLGVLSFCDDGEKFAHQWSSGYAGYSHGETAVRLERTRALTGATTCSKFEQLNPGPCSTCPLRGKVLSPIALGRQQGEIAPPKPELKIPDPPDTSLPMLPLPWKWSIRRQLVMEVSNQDRDTEILISEYPIFLDSVQIGEVSDGKYSYLFKQFLPHRGWIDIHISAKSLMGPGGLSELFGRGATIHDPKAFTAYVRYAVDTFHSANNTKTRYDQFGWKDDEKAFLYGSTLYTAAGTEKTIGSEEVRQRSAWLMPSRGGSQERWTNAANSLFAAGCEAQAVALLASFAAPLMRFHSTDEGGAIVSLVSKGSGTGKSTALAGVTSVWGQSKGLSLTNIDTKVAKALALGALGNLPVVYDEFQNRDPEVVREFVMVFTNGRDKMRGTTEGEIRHTQASWQTLLVTAQNLSLVDLLQSSLGADAPAFRILEFPMVLPAHVDHTTGDRLKKELEANAGFAGDAYLRYLLQPAVLDWSKKALAQWTDEIWKSTGLNSQHRFWVRTLGSIAVAATLVNKMGILSFQPSRIVSWAIDQVSQYRDDAPSTGQKAVNIAALGEFLNEHIADTLVVAKAWKQGERTAPPLKLPVRSLKVRFEKENLRLLVSEKAFRTWLLNKEIGARALIKELEIAGIITCARRNMTLSAGTEIPGTQIPCIEFNAGHPAVSGMLVSIAVMPGAAQGAQSHPAQQGAVPLRSV